MKWLLLFLVCGLTLGLGFRLFKDKRYLLLLLVLIPLAFILLTLKSMAIALKFVFFLLLVVAFGLAAVYIKR